MDQSRTLMNNFFRCNICDDADQVFVKNELPLQYRLTDYIIWLREESYTHITQDNDFTNEFVRHYRMDKNQ